MWPAARLPPDRANSRRAIRGETKTCRSFYCRCGFVSRVFGLADRIEPSLQRQLVEGFDRQADEYRDAVVQHAERIGEGKATFCLVAGGRSRIGKPPMCRHRLAGPNRTGFRCRVVTKREREVELR